MSKKKAFCVSGGGASVGAYLIWFKALPKDIDLELLEVPGRGLRKGEIPCETMEDIVEDFYAIIRSKVKSDSVQYYLIGYCFGVSVVYELYRRIKQDGFIMPKRLFFAGGDPIDKPRVYLFADPSREEMLKSMVVRYFPESIFRNRYQAQKIASRFVHFLFKKYKKYGRLIPVTVDEMFPDSSKSDSDYLEKTKAVDFANETLELLDVDLLIECEAREHPNRFERVSVDVTILAGKDDKLVPVEEAARWSEFTDGVCDLELIEGGHVFLFEEPGYRQCVDVLVRAARLYEQEPSSDQLLDHFKEQRS